MKIFKRTLLTLLIIILVYGGQYAWRALPILSGYGAKDICSCVFVAGRDPKNVIDNELNSVPLKYGTFEVNYNDSTATGSVFGLAKRKAIFRKGLGCTLIAEMSEEELRSQKKNLYRSQKANTNSMQWPQGDQPSDSIVVDFINQNTGDTIDFSKDNSHVELVRPVSFNYKKLNEAIDRAFIEKDTVKSKQVRTRAVVVLYNGTLIGEKYAEGFDKDSRQIGWSMTKSITNALVGILVKQGKLKLEDPAPVDAWKNDDRKNITLGDLMHMSSGLEWEENYGSPSPATNMLFKKKDMGVYAANASPESKPGEVFEYSSGTTNIISRIIREKVGDDDYYQFPYRELFNKIGMHSIVLEPDAGGTFVGSSYSFATARDFARFGLLYYNDGVWNNERILPEGWVKFSFTPPVGAKQGQYGAQWWANAGEKNNPSNRPYPDLPADAYLAEGFEGQYIFIVPSKELVVVRLGLTKSDFDMNKFVSEIIQSIK